MASKPRQLRLVVPLKETPEDFRMAAERALVNPWESPADCQRRHDHYVAQAELLEKGRERA